MVCGEKGMIPECCVKVYIRTIYDTYVNPFALAFQISAVQDALQQS